MYWDQFNEKRPDGSDKDMSPFAIANPNPPGTTDWTGERAARNDSHFALYMESAKNNPSPLVFTLQYTAEETEKRSDITALSYVTQARAEFANGVRDINSDKDWNQYLKDLKDLGIDTLVETAQAAWDRRNGK